jgi:hypothetical protein
MLWAKVSTLVCLELLSLRVIVRLYTLTSRIVKICNQTRLGGSGNTGPGWRNPASDSLAAALRTCLFCCFLDSSDNFPCRCTSALMNLSSSGSALSTFGLLAGDSRGAVACGNHLYYYTVFLLSRFASSFSVYPTRTQSTHYFKLHELPT